MTWAKFKVEAGVLSGGNYAVNVESILSHPFDGLVLKATTPPQPSQQEARVPGVVAELTRFVRTGNLITAEVALRNTGSDSELLSDMPECDGVLIITSLAV